MSRNNQNIIFPVIQASKISSGYGIRNAPIPGNSSSNHKGLDITAPRNSQIVSVEHGTVIYVGTSGEIGNGNPQTGSGYGNVMVVRNDDGTSWLYGHLETGSFNVAKGNEVNAGEFIAGLGATGSATSYHLHIQKLNSEATKIIEANTSNTSLGVTPEQLSKYSIDPTNQILSASKISTPNLKLNLTIDAQDIESQQAIDLLLGKDDSEQDNQSFPDLSSYDSITINNTKTNSYTIKSGDSFNQIADKLIAEGKISSRQDLIDANPDIIDLDIINVGDVINIPLYETKMTFSIAPKASLDNKASLTVSYVDKDGNPLSQDDIDQMILTAQDGNNNDILLLKQNSVFTTLKDGTIATLESVIEMAQTAKEVTVKFVDGYNCSVIIRKIANDNIMQSKERFLKHCLKIELIPYNFLIKIFSKMKVSYELIFFLMGICFYQGNHKLSIN